MNKGFWFSFHIVPLSSYFLEPVFDRYRSRERYSPDR